MSKCQLGPEGQHDFQSFVSPHLGGNPLMFCRICGEVRPLALDDKPLRLTVEPDGSISQIAGGPLEEPISTRPS